MTDQDLRLECLKLADKPHTDAAELLDRAQRYYDFATGHAAQAPARRPGGRGA